MRPVALRDRVAEPLVRGLVSDDALAHSALDVRLLGVEDGARVLHPAEFRGGFDVLEILIRERANEALHDLDDLSRTAERDGVRVN